MSEWNLSDIIYGEYIEYKIIQNMFPMKYYSKPSKEKAW